jgi:hypothetical protein
MRRDAGACRDESNYDVSETLWMQARSNAAKRRRTENAENQEQRARGGASWVRASGRKKAHAVTCPRPTLSLLLSARLPARRLRAPSSVLTHHPDSPTYLLHSDGGQNEDRGPPPLLLPASPSLLPRYRPPLRRPRPQRTSNIACWASRSPELVFFLGISPPPAPPPLTVILCTPPPSARPACGAHRTTRRRALGSPTRRTSRARYRS